MNLRQLRYFCEVVKTGNAAQAAKNLYVAPTAVSMQISQLEDHLGGQLFDRRKRPMELTTLGTFFYSKAMDILSSTNALERDVKKMIEGDQGWIGIGFTRSAIISFLPASIKQFHLENPSSQICLIEELSEYHEDSIKNGKFHVGISRFVNNPPQNDSIVYEKLFDDPYVVAVPNGHNLAKRESIEVEDLHNQDFIIYPKDPSSKYSEHIKHLFSSRGIHANITYEAIEINTAISLVSAGLGCTIIGESITRNTYKDVKFIPIVNIDQPSSIFALYAKSEQNQLVNKFLKHLKYI